MYAVPGTQAAPSRVPGTGKGRRPTIRDVAREAGLSSGTVSRYLNGRKWVGEASRTAIAAAIDTTGFRVNRVARSLATGRSSMVAFLLTEPQDRLFADPNYAVLLSTITSALAQHDLAPIVMTASTDTEREQALDFIVGHVDGVLLMSSHTGDPLLERLATAGVATVCCGRPLGWESRFPSASADDRAGARAATAHLISGGCRRVATISGPSDSGGAKDRLDGYRDALVDAGMAVDHDLVASGDWSHASGRVAMEHLLSAAPDLDGVFAGNDTMGLGAVAALRAAGRRVPHDVRVVGFDDAGLAATCDPPLTSVRQPFAEISHELVRMLREPASAPIAVRLPTSLIVRESAPHPR